jgi:hypothetical protein
MTRDAGAECGILGGQKCVQTKQHPGGLLNHHRGAHYANTLSCLVDVVSRLAISHALSIDSREDRLGSRYNPRVSYLGVTRSRLPRETIGA